MRNKHQMVVVESFFLLLRLGFHDGGVDSKQIKFDIVFTRMRWRIALPNFLSFFFGFGVCFDDWGTKWLALSFGLSLAPVPKRSSLLSQLVLSLPFSCSRLRFQIAHAAASDDASEWKEETGTITKTNSRGKSSSRLIFKIDGISPPLQSSGRITCNEMSQNLRLPPPQKKLKCKRENKKKKKIDDFI